MKSEFHRPACRTFKEYEYRPSHVGEASHVMYPASSELYASHSGPSAGSKDLTLNNENDSRSVREGR